MMKTASRLTLIAAAALTALLPVAAQAGTRAGDSGAVYSFAAQGVAGAVEEDDDDDDGAFILIFLSAAAAIVGGIILAIDSDDDGQSPGT